MTIVIETYCRRVRWYRLVTSVSYCWLGVYFLFFLWSLLLLLVVFVRLLNSFWVPLGSFARRRYFVVPLLLFSYQVLSANGRFHYQFRILGVLMWLNTTICDFIEECIESSVSLWYRIVHNFYSRIAMTWLVDNDLICVPWIFFLFCIDCIWRRYSVGFEMFRYMNSMEIEVSLIYVLSTLRWFETKLLWNLRLHLLPYLSIGIVRRAVVEWNNIKYDSATIPFNGTVFELSSQPPSPTISYSCA